MKQPLTSRHRRVSNREDVEKDLELKKTQKVNHDTHQGTRFPPLLAPGERIWTSDKEDAATVEKEVGPEPYHVTTSESEYRRNF